VVAMILILIAGGKEFLTAESKHSFVVCIEG
jgi:hypothetical protein